MQTTVEIYDTPSNMGGSFEVSILEEHGEKVTVRVWYGRPSPKGWIPWKDWDGYTFETDRSKLSNKQTLQLFRKE